MNGFYYQFARLAIRLLVAIYSEQLKKQLPGGYQPAEVSPLIREANAWLESTK